MSAGPHVWVVLPTYNERDDLERLVTAVMDELTRAGVDHRVLVVDDASPDGTGEIADQLAAEHPAVEVLHRARKEGIGPAYRAGFALALERGADLVVEMDADFSHDPADLPRLIAAARDADLVIGSRYVRGGGTANWSALRRGVSRAGCFYARAVLGLPVRDLTGGFKVFRARTLELIDLAMVRSRGYSFQVETTERALRRGLRVVEVPIVFHDRRHGQSKMSARIAAEAVLVLPAIRARRACPELAILTALTALAAAARFVTLGHQSLWFDEAVTVRDVLRPGLGATLAAIRHGESTPPLYYLLAWGWTRIFGMGAVEVRSLSALIGTVTVVVGWAVGRALAGARAGLVLAGLIALNPLMLWYSQEARAYALLVLLGGLSFYSWLRLLARPTARHQLAWVVSCALTLATHYFAAFVIVPEAAWLLARRGLRRPALPAVGAVAGVGALLALLALRQYHQIRVEWITHLSLLSRVRAAVISPLVGGSDAPLIRAGAAGLAALAIAVAIVAPRLERRDLRAAVPGLVIGGCALAAPLVLALAGVDLLVARNLIAAWLPLGAALAVLLGAPGAGRRGVIAVVVLCAFELAMVVAVQVSPRLQRADWRDVARVIDDPDAPRAIVSPYLGLVPLELYLPGTSRARLHAPVHAAELDVIGWGARRYRPVRPPPGFRTVRTSTVGDLVVVRLRSTRVQTQPAGTLLRSRLSRGHSIVLVS